MTNPELKGIQKSNFLFGFHNEKRKLKGKLTKAAMEYKLNWKTVPQIFNEVLRSIFLHKKFLRVIHTVHRIDVWAKYCENSLRSYQEIIVIACNDKDDDDDDDAVASVLNMRINLLHCQMPSPWIRKMLVNSIHSINHASIHHVDINEKERMNKKRAKHFTQRK